MGLSSRLSSTRRNPKKKRHNSSIESLPKDLITEVLSHVAASSHLDIFNAKLICKSFRELAEDDRLLRYVCIEELVCPWRRRTEKLAFLDRCRKNGNPKALFRQGLTDYFSEKKVESGVELLKKASKNGCLEATYVLGIILLGKEEELKEKGMNLLINNVRKSSNSLKECRKNVETIMSRHWIGKFEANYSTKFCTEAGHVLRKRSGWHMPDSEDDDDDLQYQACLCDLKVQIFYGRLLGRGFTWSELTVAIFQTWDKIGNSQIRSDHLRSYPGRIEAKFVGKHAGTMAIAYGVNRKLVKFQARNTEKWLSMNQKRIEHDWKWRSMVGDGST